MENITFDDVKSLKSEGHKILVDFWAPWCGPCRSLIPMLEDIEDDYSDVKFVKINIDENMEAAIELGIMSVPTVIFYNGVELVDRVKGLNPEAVYRNILDNL